MDKYIPMRRCIACMQSKPKPDLVKINPGEAGKGKYICKDEKCLALAVKKKRVPADFKIFD